MGGFASKRELGLLEGDDQSQFSSPQPAAAAPKRFLPYEFDPRSPSAGIDRTPILMTAQREPVADPQSPSEGIARGSITYVLSQSDQSECSSSQPVAEEPKNFLPHDLDPRSPSAGIDRTPILVPATKEMVADPRSPSDGIVRTPVAGLSPPESGQFHLINSLLDSSIFL